MIIVSDIHLHKDVEKKPILLDEIKSIVEVDSDRTLIISGDLTCRARQEEYEQVSQWFCNLREADINIVLAPGNHDTSQSILIKRIQIKKGRERYTGLADFLEKQPVVVARRDEFDMIYIIGCDVFLAVRTTHHRLRNPTRVRRKQFEWAKLILMQEGLLSENGYRLHLVTHQSLWQLPEHGAFKGDRHDHMHKRTRLREEFLEPLGFSTAINGHNHGFAHGIRQVKDYAYYLIYHIQAPTLSEHKTKNGRVEPGLVVWDPETPSSARCIHSISEL